MSNLKIVKKSSFELGDIFYHKIYKEYCMVIKKEYISNTILGSKSKIFNNKQTTVHEWIYDVQFFSKENKFRRYYETRLQNEFLKADRKAQFVIQLLNEYSDKLIIKEVS